MRLLARTEVAESEQQLVARFVDGLNTDIMHDGSDTCFYII